jgi:hypothetical protein
MSPITEKILDYTLATAIGIAIAWALVEYLTT